jgi:hypothetical protein
LSGQFGNRDHVQADVFLGKGLEGGGETLYRHGGKTGPDLPNPGTTAGDTGVDHRGYPGFDHLADIDAEGGAAEIEGRQLEGLVFTAGYFVHFQRGFKGKLGRTPDILDNRRRASHGEGTEADGLGNCRITQVGIGVFRAETGEIDPVDRRGRVR